MDFSVREAPASTEIVLSGRMTFADHDTFRDVIATFERPAGHRVVFDLSRLDWFDLRNMLQVAQSVATAALSRTESRGAHQRDDYPGLIEDWTCNQIISLRDGRMSIERGPRIVAQEAAE